MILSKRIPKLAADKVAEFHSLVEKTDSCWLWTGSSGSRNYGQFNIFGTGRNKGFKAHRVAWALHHGQSPAVTKVVRHTCDNPKCVNPAHLILGTQKKNMRDAGDKGRMGRCRGERQHCAKLTAVDVRQIRKAHARGEGPTSLGKRYNVWPSTIHWITSGKRWKHIL